ncbi:uncharacterized protein IUM83_01023 [Phytophthora cinnamomi]|uniref:uncharacterized protein n=1 Tax=Phytophthora cinnamomi TaxID=4785 RepID=UPI00355A11C5|nr:hypothetical protein IUM83_01023 [Phytophthora cinnamomi]
MAPSSPRSPAASRGRPRPPPPRPVSLLSRLEAVDRDAMHRKFALYGRQHARVDHISGADSDPTTVLQSAVLLQEDGRLAARLDDVSYLLDGLLPPARTQRGRLAQARSVLELLQLLQDAAVLQAVELSSQRRRIRAKLQQLLRSGLETAGYDGLGPEQDALRLALAVLVMVLAGSSVAHEFIEEKVLDAVGAHVVAAAARASEEDVPEAEAGEE